MYLRSKFGCGKAGTTDFSTGYAETDDATGGRLITLQLAEECTAEEYEKSKGIKTEKPPEKTEKGVFRKLKQGE